MSAVDVGFYGKLPTHGDFLSRRAPDAFVAAWDAWLQAGMAASQAALGDRWLDVYLTSPAWRFVCDGGACGPLPVAGVMVPSIDRVGRYFPLTIVAQLPAALPLLTAATQGAPFFEAAERLLVETLAMEQVNFQHFDARVASLTGELDEIAEPSEVMLAPGAAAILRGGASWQVPIESTGSLAPVLEQMVSAHLADVYRPLVLWWTEGSAMVDPSCLLGAGLPPPSSFGALLNGAWTQHRWREAPATVTRPEPEGEAAGVESGAPLRLRSAAATDVGHVRAINQDAFVERPEVGVWGVADGLGGHRDGEVASRAVCDALAELSPAGELERMIEAALEQLRQVNEHLYRGSSRSVMTDRCGSTVGALIVRGSRGAGLWAGDSRVYRWRAGQLQRLTEDHSVSEPDPVTGRQEAHGITRAIGVSPTVVVDVRRDDLRAGDRFLLCSDGLTRIVSDAELQERLAQPDLQGVVSGLIGMALDGGAPDNVTVVVAEAHE